jgi:hypothetical protein
MTGHLRFSRAVAVLLAALLCVPTVALSSEVCYSAATPFDTYAPPTNATLYTCPSLGAKTMPQLAELGWKVVRIATQTVGGTSITDQLILKRGVSIHRDGFES